MGGRERFCFVVLLGDGDQERRRHLCIHWNSDFLEERHCVFSFHIYRAQKRITSGSKPIKTRYLVCISDNGTQSIQLFKQQISRPSLLLLFSILLLHQSLEKYLQMVSFKKKKPKNKKPNKTKLSLLFKKIITTTNQIYWCNGTQLEVIFTLKGCWSPGSFTHSLLVSTPQSQPHASPDFSLGL